MRRLRCALREIDLQPEPRLKYYGKRTRPNRHFRDLSPLRDGHCLQVKVREQQGAFGGANRAGRSPRPTHGGGGRRRHLSPMKNWIKSSPTRKLPPKRARSSRRSFPRQRCGKFSNTSTRKPPGCESPWRTRADQRVEDREISITLKLRYVSSSRPSGGTTETPYLRCLDAPSPKHGSSTAAHEIGSK